MKSLNNLFPETPRKSCKDLWNSYMLEGATYDACDIPFCPTTAKEIPKSIISIKDARTLYDSEIKKGNFNFKCDSFIHFYVDDQYFDGPRAGVWNNPQKYYQLVTHFAGMITIDYSTYLDFPDPLLRYNTFRMRTIGYYFGKKGIPIINNVRWGGKETWEYCFAGLPMHSVLSIGTLASGIRFKKYRNVITDGLEYLALNHKPAALITVGSTPLPVFDDLRDSGIKIITFKSDTAKYYEMKEKRK